MTIRKQVKRFWKMFESERANLEKAFLEHNHEEITEINKILATYFEELCNCQIDISEEDGIFEFTMLPEMDKNAQIICALTKKMAPTSMQDWVIHSCLPPLTQKALNTVLRLENDEYTCNDFKVYYEVDKESHCLNVNLYCPAFAHLEPNKALEIGYYMTELFIGEAALEGYINHVDVIDQQPLEGKGVLLPYFYELLLDIVEDEKWSQYDDPTSIYRVYQINEDKLSDEVRKDMKVIFTIHPSLLEEMLNDNYHLASEFLDFGGEYGYLYYPHENSEVNDSLMRQTLEKNLNELLYPMGFARSIGGAIGTKYAYIDLAVFDKEDFIKALEKINAKLKTKLQYVSFE